MITPYILDNYQLLEKLGEGGAGEVFRGIDLVLEREVAIKSLRPELACRRDIVERFRAEAKTLAKLNHPNIATLYSFGEQGERVFMVMEFVRGQTCENFISSTSPLPWKQATAILCQALDGVAHAHGLGVIHRDLKPANLMVTDTGLVKVMDFGIARLLGAPRATRVGHFVGTPQYTAPELFRGQEAGAGADIYALGIVLYELLTGQVPFRYESVYDLMTAHMEEMPTLPSHVAEQVPAEVIAALMQALAKSPGERFQSAEEFRLALNHGQQVAVGPSLIPIREPAVLSPILANENPPVSAPCTSNSGDAQLYDVRPTGLLEGTAQKRNPRMIVMFTLAGITAVFFLFKQTQPLTSVVPSSALSPKPAEGLAVRHWAERSSAVPPASALSSVVWMLAPPAPLLIPSKERPGYMLGSMEMAVMKSLPLKAKTGDSQQTRKVVGATKQNSAIAKTKTPLPQKKSTRQELPSQQGWVFKK